MKSIPFTVIKVIIGGVVVRGGGLGGGGTGITTQSSDHENGEMICTLFGDSHLVGMQPYV